MAENTKPVAGKDGDVYVPFSERTGEEAVVYFTRDLSAQGLQKIFERVKANLIGKIAVKLHTGEPHGPNILPRPWVKNLIETEIPDATIVETNTYYEGPRYDTKDHLETLKTNGWTFCPVDIMDDGDDYAYLPVNGGKWFTKMSVGKHMLNYDSMLVLTHFKGHTMGGFGGSDKNIGIGCASGHEGKGWIHTQEGSSDLWSVSQEELMEKITESTKATIDHFGKHISYINVMRNMSVSCDCEGTGAAPVVTPNVGILASLDILAVDQACIDCVFAMNEKDGKALRERILTRHGLRQLSYMKELGMGHDRYRLIDIDNGDKEITAADAVKDLKPFQAE